MENLSYDDVTLLCKSIDAWEREPAIRSSAAVIIIAVVGKMAKRTDEEIKCEMDKDESRAKSECNRRRDEGCLLRAKLIGIRQQLESDAADKILSEAAE